MSVNLTVNVRTPPHRSGSGALPNLFRAAVTLSVLLAGWMVLAQVSETVGSDTNAPSDAASSLVAERRRGPAILVHRGATAFAPENTLRAYSLAMDYGADGVEVDLRRTRDGVLVLFHDESVDRLLRGVGRVREHTLAQLRALRPVTWRGRPLGGMVPTFGEFLELARARAMLLHLDLKEPDLEADVARQLAAAGVWPQVVSINAAHAGTLRRDPRFHPLRYKAPGLYAGRRDVDPAAVKAALASPGELLLVDDPRVAAQVLERPPPRATWMAVERHFHVPAVVTSSGHGVDAWPPPRVVERLNGLRPPPTVERLLSLLADSDPPPAGLDTMQSVVLFTTRAWAVGELGQRGENSRRVRRALEQVMDHPFPVADTELDGLDVALAVRALGELGATASAGHLVRLFQAGAAGQVDPEDGSARWRRWRLQRCVMVAQGEMPCRTVRRFLEDYVALPEAGAARYGPPVFEEATRSLLAQRLDWGAIARLLRSPNPAVRGAAILECRDHLTEERRLALRRAAPWALKLPGPAAVIPAP